jgi:hypothetical protein
MASSEVEAVAAELLAGLPQRLDQVFRHWSRSAPARSAWGRSAGSPSAR